MNHLWKWILSFIICSSFIPDVQCSVQDLTMGQEEGQASSLSRSYRNPNAFQRGGAYLTLELFNGRAQDTFLVGAPYAAIVHTILLTLDRSFGNQVNDFTFFENNIGHKASYRIAAGYDYPSKRADCGYGISLELMHFDASHFSQTPFTVSDIGEPFPSILGVYTSQVVDNVLLTYFPLASNVPGFFSQASLNSDIRYDHVDLLGHNASVICNRALMYLIGGIRYISLQEHNYANYTFSPSPEEIESLGDLTVEDAVRIHNSFKGIGTNAGVAGYYPITRNLIFSAQVTVLIIYGNSNSHYDEDLTQPITEGEPVHYHAKSETDRIVPGITSKISLGYVIRFCNCSSLFIEGGYHADKYFGINNNIALLNAAHGTKGSTLATNKYTDFDLSGPFVGLTYHF